MEQIILILILSLQVLKAIQNLLGDRKVDKKIQKIGEGLSVALTDHAKLTVKGVTGAMGYYEGKQKKAAASQIEGLGDVVEQIKPFAELLKGAENGGQDGKKTGWI